MAPRVMKGLTIFNKEYMFIKEAIRKRRQEVRTSLTQNAIDERTFQDQESARIAAAELRGKEVREERISRPETQRCINAITAAMDDPVLKGLLSEIQKRAFLRTFMRPPEFVYPTVMEATEKEVIIGRGQINFFNGNLKFGYFFHDGTVYIEVSDLEPIKIEYMTVKYKTYTLDQLVQTLLQQIALYDEDRELRETGYFNRMAGWFGLEIGEKEENWLP